MNRRVAVIGPGRVGTALALALEHAGDRIVAVAGRGPDTLAAFRRRLPSAEVLPPERAGTTADHVLVCVPDDELAGVVRHAAAAGGVVPGSRWLHTSGGHGADVMRPARLAGAQVAACHPAMTFPDPDTALERLPGISWAVTAGSEEELGWVRVLVTDLRGRPVTVDEPNRTLYHLGLSVGSNGTSAVVTLARDLLLGAGLEQPAAFLAPLVAAAGEHAAARGAAALTGPVRRGDAGTVRRHLGELGTVMPEAVEAYVALARLMVDQARRAGADPERLEAVDQALADPVTPPVTRP